MYTITRYFKKATCELSSKDAECVEVSSANGSLSQAVLSFAALAQLLRLQAKQHEKGNGATTAKSPKAVSADTE